MLKRISIDVELPDVAPEGYRPLPFARLGAERSDNLARLASALRTAEMPSDLELVLGALADAIGAAEPVEVEPVE
ncbi:MAG: hypothetical protein MUC43_00135 [Pirellula sp.]|jgi:hypothetical protein|nr:hypothetical protein [Pirellula sp.]